MDHTDELRKYGRVWLRGALSTAEVDDLAALADVGNRPGMRMEMTAELFRLVGPNSRLAAESSAFGCDANPVRLVAFNKTSETNWAVPWHQDRVIAVASKHEAEGYSNWVPKSGFWHCEAPEALLSTMIFVRVHIDASTDTNGPLELALGSHRNGFVSASDAGAIASKCEIETCRAAAGDALIVHALTLHRSSSAIVPNRRRTLRVDFAPRGLLPSPLEWAIGASPTA